MSDVSAPHREPAIPPSSDFKRVGDVRAVLRSLDAGQFQPASWLIEQMLWNPRLRGVVETRLNGLLSTAIRWEPGRDNALGRRAAKAILDDWPLIADVSTRKLLHQWGLLLGVGPAQMHWYRSRGSNRLIPRLQVYPPQWLSWDWSRRRYRIYTADAGLVDAVSPSLAGPDERNDNLWVMHEPFGQHSWRMGLVHATWYTWLGHEWARRDQSRASEKHGLGTFKAKYPHNADKTDANKFVDGIRKLNSEGVVPCEQYEDGVGFDVETLEFQGGNTYDVIHRTKDSSAVDLAVLYLGHNLTTEAKGGSYAAANVGDLIRGDIKAFDAAAEFATFWRQVLWWWALLNFGDGELAPIAVYETDPPAVNQAAAQTLQLLAQAIAVLTKVAPWVDFPGLLERFRVPQQAQATVLTMPVVAPGDGAALALEQTFAAVAQALDGVARQNRGAAQRALELWTAALIQGEELARIVLA